MHELKRRAVAESVGGEAVDLHRGGRRVCLGAAAARAETPVVLGDDIEAGLGAAGAEGLREHQHAEAVAAAAEGSGAAGATPDGKGEFTYLDGPTTSVPMPTPTQPDPRFYGTDAKPNVMDKAAGVVKDKLSKK